MKVKAKVHTVAVFVDILFLEKSGSTSNSALLNDWITVNSHFGRKFYSAGYSTEHTGDTIRLKKWRQEVPARRLSPST